MKTIKINDEIINAVRAICNDVPLTAEKTGKILMGACCKFYFLPAGERWITFMGALESGYNDEWLGTTFTLDGIKQLRNLCEAIINAEEY